MLQEIGALVVAEGVENEREGVIALESQADLCRAIILPARPRNYRTASWYCRCWTPLGTIMKCANTPAVRGARQCTAACTRRSVSAPTR